MTRLFWVALTMLAAAALLSAGCGRTDAADGAARSADKAANTGPGADLVVRNALIYTGDPKLPEATALASKGGKLSYVGEEAGIAAFIGSKTKVIDAAGRRLIPGLHDVHQHTLEGHLALIDCVLDGTETDPEAFIDTVAACKPTIARGWILGHGHTIHTLLAAKRAPRLILDDTGHKGPIAIMEATSHSTWVNSKALQELGIDDKTPDPPGGIIVRDAGGKATGLLIDAAGEWPWDGALKSTPALDKANEQALREGLAHNNRWGITSAVDARVYWQRGYLDTYNAVAKAGDMTVRMVLSLWASPSAADDKQIGDLEAMYADDGGVLRVSMVKLYDDGLLGNTTAALLQPYSGKTLTKHAKGLNYFDAERLPRYVKELSAAGFRMHIHAIGDRAVHEALNAIEVAYQLGGKGGAKHRLTHVEMLDKADIPRFSQLGVGADMQLNDHTHDSHIGDYEALLGKKRPHDKLWLLRALWDTGATVALSSDYDVGPISPFVGMQHALTMGAGRQLQSVGDALAAYTTKAARIMGSEALTGTLEVGKAADFAVLDRDFISIGSTPAGRSKIGKTKVLLTVMGGREVFADGPFKR